MESAFKMVRITFFKKAIKLLKSGNFFVHRHFMNMMRVAQLCGFCSKQDRAIGGLGVCGSKCQQPRGQTGEGEGGC